MKIKNFNGTLNIFLVVLEIFKVIGLEIFLLKATVQKDNFLGNVLFIYLEVKDIFSSVLFLTASIKAIIELAQNFKVSEIFKGVWKNKEGVGNFIVDFFQNRTIGNEAPIEGIYF